MTEGARSSSASATDAARACIAILCERLGSKGVLTPDDMLAKYESGARYGSGRAAFVARPASTSEVSFVLATCRSHGIDLVVQGANTGLVGAASPDPSGHQGVLSLERHNRHFELNLQNRSVSVSAGTTLSAVNEKLAAHGLWFPIDLGADPSIGGMIATNTGGTRFLRYGDVRRNLLGVEVALEDGSIMDALDTVRKNNTGFDTKQLFVGTGGRFGVVTTAVLEVQPLPRDTATALLVPSSSEAIVENLLKLEAAFGLQLTAFEGMSRTALECAFSHASSLRNPFQEALPDYALLLEVSSWSLNRISTASLQETLEEELSEGFKSGLLVDAYLQDPANLWSIRHHISDGLKARGQVIALDVSVPRDHFTQFRQDAIAAVGRLADHILVADFGHVGDGGVHFNMIWPTLVPFSADVAENCRRAVYDLVAAAGGSVSAEHGVGPFNEHLVRDYVSPSKRGIEERVAQAFVGDTRSSSEPWQLT